GSANGGKVFLLTTADPITLNTTALAFSAISGASVTAADTTVVVTGSAVKRAPITGDVTIADGSNAAAITANAIIDADINAAAAIAWSKLAAAIGNLGFT